MKLCPITAHKSSQNQIRNFTGTFQNGTPPAPKTPSFHGLDYRFVRDEMPWIQPITDGRGFCVGYADESGVIS